MWPRFCKCKLKKKEKKKKNIHHKDNISAVARAEITLCSLMELIMAAGYACNFYSNILNWWKRLYPIEAKKYK